MSLTEREKELHQAWLHYREIGDEKKAHEAITQLVKIIAKKGVRIVNRKVEK